MSGFDAFLANNAQRLIAMFHHRIAIAMYLLVPFSQPGQLPTTRCSSMSRASARGGTGRLMTPAQFRRPSTQLPWAQPSASRQDATESELSVYGQAFDIWAMAPPLNGPTTNQTTRAALRALKRAIAIQGMMTRR